ncbi:hypothetical protein [Paratractidigestivibacter sp.]|uniref:phasin family protein n=1 Tax=Paratractidigestivibacter sp. TaxID=2847316 RepID=UPI002ABE2383|nr:hypothetical protein [Paratractidigestivibacter sp.]
MAGIDVGDSLYKVFLASVGAVATTAEKSQKVVDEFVKRGELTVEQGRALNTELTRKAKESFDAAVGNASDAALKSKLQGMTPEERVAYAAKVAEMSAAIEAEAAKEKAEDVFDTAEEKAADVADAVADAVDDAVEADDVE